MDRREGTQRTPKGRMARGKAHVRSVGECAGQSGLANRGTERGKKVESDRIRVNQGDLCGIEAPDSGSCRHAIPAPRIEVCASARCIAD